MLLPARTVFRDARFLLLTLLILALAPSWGHADTIPYTADLLTLNNSGASGRASLIHDPHNQTLRVEIRARGMEPGQLHPQHIHGLSGGRNSTNPTLACCDPDGDGFIEVLEGAKAYGPIIMNVTSPPGRAPSGFPTAAADGTYHFLETFDLKDARTFAGVMPPTGHENPDQSLLFPLENREIVLHGLTVPAGVGTGTAGEVDGTAGYKLVLPVASGEIVLVPEPSSVLLLGSGFLGLAGALWRRRSGT